MKKTVTQNGNQESENGAGAVTSHLRDTLDVGAAVMARRAPGWTRSLWLQGASLCLTHAHLGASCRALQLPAFPQQQHSMGTGTLTPPGPRDDTRSSRWSPLLAWRSRCGARKEPEERGCHLHRGQAGHWHLCTHHCPVPPPHTTDFTPLHVRGFHC